MGAAGVKSIAVSTATRYWLDELKKDGETYSDVIDRLIDNYEMNRDSGEESTPKKYACCIQYDSPPGSSCHVVNACTGLIIRCIKEECPAWVEILP